MKQKLLNKIFIFFILTILSLCCFIFLIFSKNTEIEDVKYEKKEVSNNENPQDITGKSLYLAPLQIDITLPLIKDELEVFIIEPRFDLEFNNIKFEVKLKNSNKVRSVVEDQKLYLVAKGGDAFDFSDALTPLAIELKRQDFDNIKVTLQADLNGLSPDSFQESILDTFNIQASEMSLKTNLEDRYEFKTLMTSKWLGVDCLKNIQDIDQSTSQKERLEIDGEIIYIQEKDVLLFKDGKWCLKNANENTLLYPIARVKSINSKAVEIDAWDVQGNNKYTFSINPISKAQFVVKVDGLITAVKPRTNTHLSCIFDKQRLILKSKDLLIKKDNRWKLLKKDVVLDDIKTEELFYFDKIEVRGSKKFLIGYLFNTLRTNFQKIEVPIISQATLKRGKKR